jgi:sulfide dehydrogenase cytochrome subunit
MNVSLMLRVFFAVCVLNLSVAAVAAEFSIALSWNCAGCHGPAGHSVGPTVPSIGGMDERYFFSVMRNFKLDERDSTIMGRLAKGYRLAEIREMAKYFAGSGWGNAGVTVSDELFASGQAVHDEHCAECHEDGGRFQDKEVPRLAGQWPDYLLLQLRDYQRAELNMPQPDKMRERLRDLTPDDLAAVSAFYGGVDDDTPITPPLKLKQGEGLD